MCVWVDVSLYPWWCQLAVAVKPASAPPGCGYPGTVGTRSSWHQFCHLISLSFRHFFYSCPPVLGFYLFCMLDTILRRGLTARVSPWSLMPFTQNSAQNLLLRSHPAKKVPPTFCIWQGVILPRIGRSPFILGKQEDDQLDIRRHGVRLSRRHN